ncbi:class I SAM-dependent DNA methyltransferase [Aliarcobacter butzleri]|uniref:class I SAM-dependent DNA methyltransferase n=1 Tax=Aliarcobacter butzleri TaxID=28197 RepID=UPI001EDC9CE8|nr:class I SAM-dependent methyltransferase [Aliarcobacter butzleri]MCG3696199.1 class I SAM-dependent methyltransferase [Aliarcobacter butzleri]MCG3698317.1 class I SAM-dependent methyltransferase [Aliarcobacter butzleri]MCG3717995.1 class I SAM-dependent methyltransferase [Aliarcobacter butzleri]MCT7551687.1 class I SAM-dependent methyltransferase [Aliarcobacter butzleri]MCT7618737.1 class I SAM-dependent methyltransferase [Aliarcobacter butzleri]
MGLDLYAKVEPYLDFEEEVYTLHKEFLRFVMVNDLDNIIDIGCGQGYFLENLKVNKKKYFGIDLSVEQIKVCQEKNLNAQAIDLKDVKEKFDCATAIFDVLNYIPKNELKIFLEQTYEILNQNAYFIFDVNSYFGFDEVAQGTITIDVEDKFIAIDANFENNKLQTDITLFEKQENGLFSKEQDSIIQEYHSKEFLTKILEEIGFKQIEIKEFNLHTDEIADKLIFICKK